MPRSLVRLTDWSADDIEHVFRLAEAYRQGRGPTVNGCAAMFFPAASVRTRITFERGAHLMGLQPVLFPPETLDKPEEPADVVGYLANWADVVVARHPDIAVVERLAAPGTLPVINAMTDANHPCEVLADVYTLARTQDVRTLRFVFVGADGNIARAWAEIAAVLGLDLIQSCPLDLATAGVTCVTDLRAAMHGADVVLTDTFGSNTAALEPYRVTAEVMALARPGALLCPCPPFTRGAEVSADAVRPGGPFVGYEFKASLLHVHQAVLATCLDLGQ
jgi:ornithine carbamoyltransferase